MGKGKSLQKRIDKQNLLLLALITILFLIMSLVKPDIFPTWENINSMLLQISEIGLLCIGMMLAFLIGGIDLSIVSNAVLSSTIAGYVMIFLSKQIHPVAAIVLCIIVAMMLGLVGGIFNGVLISKINIPPILATLGTNSLFRGVAIGITGGSTLGGFPKQFASIGNGRIFGIYYSFIIFLAAAFLMSVYLTKTRGGMQAAYMGSNPKASKFSGIDNVKITIINYTISGFVGSIAGIIMMSRSNSINPDYGTSYLLQTILICVIAGVNINGGRARISELVLALLLMQMISTSFNMLFVGYSGVSFFKNVVWGSLLIVLMIAKYYRTSNKGNVKRKGVKSNA